MQRYLEVSFDGRGGHSLSLEGRREREGMTPPARPAKEESFVSTSRLSNERTNERKTEREEE